MNRTGNHGSASFTLGESSKSVPFIGPGDKVALITGAGDALWTWRKYIDDSGLGFPGERIVACTIFRNESQISSVQLIREACGIADAIWIDRRRYTFVDAAKIKSENPGYCFKLAGWRLVRDEHGKPRLTKKGQLILEYP
jgi:hypothetical protein